MIFDGQRWRKSRKVVTLPDEYNVGSMKNYRMFGRICKPDTKGAVATNWHYKDNEKTKVYAIPVKCDGHSLTNMMYGADGYMYLAYDGKCYVRKRKKKIWKDPNFKL